MSGGPSRRNLEPHRPVRSTVKGLQDSCLGVPQHGISNLTNPYKVLSKDFRILVWGSLSTGSRTSQTRTKYCPMTSLKSKWLELRLKSCSFGHSGSGWGSDHARHFQDQRTSQTSQDSCLGVPTHGNFPGPSLPVRVLIASQDFASGERIERPTITPK